MQIEKCNIPDVMLIKPRVFGDTRGFFLETYNQARYQDAGFPDVQFVQDNHSHSQRGVLRGLHFQLQHPQGKLVQVMRGEVLDVAVDIRHGSPSFGRWCSARLSGENHYQLWVPAGFAHGFCVLSPTADFLYKCTDVYHPEDEGAIRWDDVDITIDWQLGTTVPQLSAKDVAAPLLRDLSIKQLPVYIPKESV